MRFAGGTIRQFYRAQEVLYQHRADLGRDQRETVVSGQAPFSGDPGAAAGAGRRVR